MQLFHKLRGHRIACLALYKAFLNHTRNLPFSKTVKKQATAKISRDFRKNRNLQGLENIRKTLRSAYEDELLFRKAATQDPTSVSILQQKLASLKALKKVQTAISRAPPRPPPTFPPPIPPTRKRKLKALVRSSRKRSAILLRIRRKIPILTEGNNFPLLRRPGRRQSLQVSMVMKQRIATRQRRSDLMDQLDVTLDLARGEDVFDRLLRRSGAGVVEEGVGEEGSWVDEVYQHIRQVHGCLKRAEEKNMQLSTRFIEIIEKEKRTKAEMKANYTRVKRREQRARRNRRRKGVE